MQWSYSRNNNFEKNTNERVNNNNYNKKREKHDGWADAPNSAVQLMN